MDGGMNVERMRQRIGFWETSRSNSSGRDRQTPDALQGDLNSAVVWLKELSVGEIGRWGLINEGFPTLSTSNLRTLLVFPLLFPLLIHLLDIPWSSTTSIPSISSPYSTIVLSFLSLPFLHLFRHPVSPAAPLPMPQTRSKHPPPDPNNPDTGYVRLIS